MKRHKWQALGLVVLGLAAMAVFSIVNSHTVVAQVPPNGLSVPVLPVGTPFAITLCTSAAHGLCLPGRNESYMIPANRHFSIEYIDGGCIIAAGAVDSAFVDTVDLAVNTGVGQYFHHIAWTYLPVPQAEPFPSEAIRPAFSVPARITGEPGTAIFLEMLSRQPADGNVSCELTLTGRQY